ncbi:MAG: exonuclease subunit SbcD, partial [Chloroflexi bacterium]|nr:exonuclease subunit SbcD [Chloroflexota bacterium]
MRILHISDIHIGVENYGHPASDAEVEALPPYFAPGVDRKQFVGVSTRLLDFLTTFDWAIQYGIDHNVDVLVFSGDAYKNRDPSQTHQREFARRIARLAEAHIPVFLTVGNHDLPHVANRATALEIFPTLAVENVTVGSTLGTHVIQTRQGPLQIVALPWIRIGQFMAKEETRDLTLEQIKNLVEARLTSLLEDEVSRLDPALPAILSAHVTVSGARLASERSMMLGNDHVLGLGTIANQAFDYVALGHIHKQQMLTQHPPVVYPGSIQRIDFSEEHDDKGFMLIELDAAKPRGERIVSCDFVQVDARRMLTMDVQTRPGEDPTDAALEVAGKFAGEGLEDSIVRMRISMEAEQEPAFSEARVRQALTSAFHLAGIERTVHRE